MSVNDLIRGSGGGGGGGGGKGGGGGGSSGGGTRVAQESPDSLRSRQMARVIDVISEGEISGLVNGLKSVYLDDTPVQNADDSYNFSGITLLDRVGTQSQTYLPGFPATEAETAVSTRVVAATPVVRSISNANVDAVRVTLGIPRLTSQNTTNGDLNGTSVQIAIDVQTAGAGYVQQLSDTISGKTTTRYQRAYRIELPGSGPWDVRVRRLTADSGSAALSNETWFDSFTEIIDSKLSYPNTALVGLSVSAEMFRAIPRRSYDIKGLLVRIPANYNPLTRVYTGAWDGTFSVAWTDNPAWCFYDLLTNERYGLGEFIVANQVDKWTLYQIAQYCDQLVDNGYGSTEPRFTCNLYLQTREEAYRVINSLASIFRGMVYWAGGTVVPVQDAPADVAGIFTPANVIGGDFNYSGSAARSRHTVALVSWNDPEDRYRQKIEYVADEAGISRYGLIQTDVLAVGCTSRGQAHRLGKWLLYTERMETETVTFRAGFDGLVAAPGDVIQTSDPVRAGVRMGGRVVSATTTAVTLDQSITIESGKIYTLWSVLADGVVESRSVTTAAGTGTVLTVTPAFTAAPQALAMWVLAASDLLPETWRVMTMREIDATTAEITALAHNPDKFAAVEEGMVLEALPVTTLTAMPDVPTNVAHVESSYLAAPGVVASSVALSWSGNSPRYQVMWRLAAGNWTMVEVVSPAVSVENIIAGWYDFRIVAINALGIMSATATYSAEMFGNTEPPASVTGFTATFAFPVVRLSWDANAEPDVVEYQVRKGASWAAGTVLNKVAATSLDVSPTGNGTETYWISARTRSRGALLSVAVSTTVTINQLGAPTGIVLDPGLESLFWQCATPAAPEFSGIRVYCSPTNGFTPGAGSLVYDGPNTNGIITRLQDGTPLEASGTYYVRIDAYNVYGKTGTTAAAQLSATCRAAPGSGTDTLAAINAILGSTTSTTQLTLTPGNFAIQATDGSKYPFAVVDTGGGVYKTLLNSDVLIGGNVTIDNLTTGALPSNVVMSLGAGMVQLDGAGQIRAYANTGANANYVRLTAGNIDFRMWIAALSQYVDYNYMSRVEYGSATNGTTVLIPGYWKTQPRVMVSPASMGLYKSAYPGQDQTLNCSVANLVLQATKTMEWQFDPTATLTLAANTGQTVINAVSGALSGNWTSNSYTTAANCSSILARVSALSVRGNGASQYFYRQYRWRIEYYSGGAWVTTDTFTAQVAIGAQTSSAVASNKSITFPSAAAWQWRVYMEFSDVSTAVFGAVSYTYTQETVTAANKVATVTLADTCSGPNMNMPPSAASGDTSAPSYTTPTGSGEIYEVTFYASAQLTSTYSSTCLTPPQYPQRTGQFGWGGTTSTFSSLGQGDTATSSGSPTSYSNTRTGSNLVWSSLVSSYAPLAKANVAAGYYWYNSAAAGNLYYYAPFSGGSATATLSSLSALIKRRTLTANSTTAVNNATLINNDFTLTSAQVLATGTLNWIAVGS